MAVDWKLLIEVRERQKRTAMEAVARDRAAADQSLALLQQAHAQLQQQIDAKAAHWQATTGALSGGACSVAQLRQASAWSGALDGHIATAATGVAQAQGLHQQREQVLQESRQRMRAAAGEVEKAQQMQQRRLQQQRRLHEARQEDVAEEVASVTWSSRRFS
jgi:hypothetical protein